MLNLRILRRVALTGTVLALAASTPSAALHSRGDVTSSTAAAIPPGRNGSPDSLVDRVADFYGAYIDARYGSGDTRLAQAMRDHYLTAGLRHSLVQWEAAHRLDGMLRAKGVPTAWQVAYNDSGMGHTWIRVTLTWQGSGNRSHLTHLVIQADLATMRISDIETDE
ncbi:hypothetical protein ACFV2N_46360 [Streptomyces sp. NPDC059680]|uniref:hypothetical protein n=1 Tax=Streptomyces sp. NPDC059680 TaxID=3346904 RepID=UPI003686A9C6